MSVATLMASAMIVAMQAQSAVPQSALPPGAAVGPMSTSSPHVLFRWTDFKGQINYGDRPPPDAQNVIRIDLMTIGENTQSLLPYLVRRAASNFPVMLFTSKNCPPCVTARSFLNQRGIRPQRVRCRRHLLQDWNVIRAGTSAQRDPNDPSYFRVAYDASFVVSRDGAVSVVKLAEADELASPIAKDGARDASNP